LEAVFSLGQETKRLAEHITRRAASPGTLGTSQVTISVRSRKVLQTERVKNSDLHRFKINLIDHQRDPTSPFVAHARPFSPRTRYDTHMTIRRCTDSELETIGSIINEAAEAYRGVIPADCWHEPYMPHEALVAEIAAGVEFWGWDKEGAPVGVMGLQRVRDVTLIRHAYVRPSHQSHGIGRELLNTLVSKSAGRLLVGTWADATWAIRFYERHGFRLIGGEEKDRLLDTYWTISDRQRDTSVVLTR
jgi:GNAT superfamily N-acetyltransferase